MTFARVFAFFCHISFLQFILRLMLDEVVYVTKKGNENLTK